MWDYNRILQAKRFYCCWQSFRLQPLWLAAFFRYDLYISQKGKWEGVPSSSLPLLVLHTSPLALTAHSVRNGYWLAFLHGLSMYHCLYSLFPALILLSSLRALKPHDAVQPESHRTPLPLAFSYCQPRWLLHDKGTLSFLQEEHCAPSSWGKMWIWITSSSAFWLPLPFITPFCTFILDAIYVIHPSLSTQTITAVLLQLRLLLSYGSITVLILL